MTIVPLLVAGAEGLVVYQETYNQSAYAELHLAGPKKDFDWRLDSPERAYTAGFRRLGIGALFGLAPWKGEAYGACRPHRLSFENMLEILSYHLNFLTCGRTCRRLWPTISGLRGTENLSRLSWHPAPLLPASRPSLVNP